MLKSVKTKITALVLCGIILSSIIIGGTGIVSSCRVVSADSTQIMNLTCSNQSKKIDSMFARIEQSIETLTVYAAQQLDDFERFKTDNTYVNNYSQSLLDIAINTAQNTEGALTVYIRYNPEFTAPESGLFYSKDSKDGSFKDLTPTNLALYDPSDREHVGWFYEPAQKRTGTWMSPYFNDNINVEIISYIVPFYVNHVLVGVVGMDIDFSILEFIIKNTYAYHSGYAFLADAQSKVVYHKNLARGTDLTEYNQGEFYRMAKILQTDSSSESGLLSYTYRGEKKKASFNILLNGMRLVITAPVREIDDQANKLLLQMVITVLIIISIAIFLTILYTKRLVKPLLELNVAAQKIANGDLSVSITHQSADEVGTLAESFRQTVSHLHKYISCINEMAYRDLLTGVKNKTAYLEIVNRMDDLTRLKSIHYAVLVFNLNDLKRINDTHGYDFGDMLIIHSCNIICKVFKSSPVYRIGGDEFVTLLENNDYDHYLYLLEKFQAEINTHNQNPKNEVKISIARGISIYSEETDLTYNDVFKRADNAMHRNKIEMKIKK